MMFSCESAIGPMGTMVSANDVCSENLRLFWSARDPNVSCSRAAGIPKQSYAYILNFAGLLLKKNDSDLFED